jgi:predicted TIM-barrel fold metal-dependent hydrolase
MRVDVHAHCYPKPYMQELYKMGVGQDGWVGVKIDEWEGSEERIAKMDELGIDVQVLGLSDPNVYFSDAGLSKDLAQITNDFIADIAKKHPERFLALASIPLTELNNAMEELSRAIDGLKMDGIVLGTNVDRRPLSDDLYLPFFEEVNRRRIPVVLHPIRSIAESVMPKEDWSLGIAAQVGFLFETTRVIAQMTFKGTFQRLQNLTFILPHSGGAIPFICPRWDIFYRSRPDGHRLKELPYPPTHYLKRHYYDTALSYAHSALNCTLALAGIDHVCFGTDHPFTADFRAQETIESIECYGFSVEEKEKIYFRNAKRLFPGL